MLLYEINNLDAVMGHKGLLSRNPEEGGGDG